MRKKGRGGLIFAVIITIIIAALLFYIYQVIHREVTVQKNTTENGRGDFSQKPSGEDFQKKAEADSQSPRNMIIPGRKRIAILIDDIGYDLLPVNELLKIDAPITFAILPYYAHSIRAADILHRSKREILLHLPMEPHTYPHERPGNGAIFLSMADEQIRKELEKSLLAVPYISGVNNHMGSKFMEDKAKLAVVFNELKKRNLFFVDSRTTPLSRGSEIAKETGLPFISRKMFIDNDRDYTTTFRNLKTFLNREYRGGEEAIVIIGHPYPETVQALRETIPVLKADGIEIVPVSHLIDKLH